MGGRIILTGNYENIFCELAIYIYIERERESEIMREIGLKI